MWWRLAKYENFVYFLLSLGIILFAAIIWEYYGAFISNSVILTFIYFMYCAIGSFVIFGMMTEAIKNIYRESIDFYDLMLFIEAKGKLQKLKEEKKKTENKVANRSVARNVINFLGKFLSYFTRPFSSASSASSAQSETSQDSNPKILQSGQTGQDSDQLDAVPETVLVQSQEAKSQIAEEKVVKKEELATKDDRVKSLDPIEKAVDRIRNAIARVAGKKWPEVSPLAEKILSYYLAEPEASSLGALSQFPNKIAEALAKIPLLVHVADVVEMTEPLSKKYEGFLSTQLALMIGALCHDIGKLKSVWSKYDPLYSGRKHPEYGALFLSSIRETLQLPFSSEWWDKVVKAVRYHHSLNEDINFLKDLKEADYKARRMESSADDAELQKFFKETIGDLSSAGYEEVISRFVGNFKERVIGRFKTDPSLFYLIHKRRIYTFIAETPEGTQFFYLDPEYIIKTCIDEDPTLSNLVAGYRTPYGYLRNNIKAKLFEGLVQACYIISKDMHEIIFSDQIKNFVSCGLNKSKNSILAFVLNSQKLKEEGIDLYQTIETVISNVSRRPQEFYIGSAQDLTADRELYIPNKDLYSRYSS